MIVITILSCLKDNRLVKIADENGGVTTRRRGRGRGKSRTKSRVWGKIDRF